MKRRTCGECKWAESVYGTQADCRRFPPVPCWESRMDHYGQTSLETVFRYPEVYATTTACGEFGEATEGGTDE